MNRVVDYRGDLYSFGATLYHLLTGKFPFEARSEMGFVHAHIAKEPVPLHQVNANYLLFYQKKCVHPVEVMM